MLSSLLQEDSIAQVEFQALLTDRKYLCGWGLGEGGGITYGWAVPVRWWPCQIVSSLEHLEPGVLSRYLLDSLRGSYLVLQLTFEVFTVIITILVLSPQECICLAQGFVAVHLGQSQWSNLQRACSSSNLTSDATLAKWMWSLSYNVTDKEWKSGEVTVGKAKGRGRIWTKAWFPISFTLHLCRVGRGGGGGGIVLQKFRVVAVGMPGSLLVRVDRVLKTPRGVSYFPIRQ